MATQIPVDDIEIRPGREAEAVSLVVCSLEPWGEVRRRIRILVDEIVDLEPELQVLFVAPPVDIPHQVRRGQFAGLTAPVLSKVHPRIHVLQPRKWLPRLLGPFADRSLERQILGAIGELGLERPLLWINDASYAHFAVRTGWPSLYDITDDWLLAPLADRQRDRLEADEQLLMEHSQVVVVCSPDLARSRGGIRSVELLPNGVDVDLFRADRPRPADLPPGPVALYVGTLHAWRIDVPLVLELAGARPDVQVVLVGPNSLPGEVTAGLERVANVHILGSRPYDQVPAYMQHADVVFVPHLVNAFTESLDPIKAYECVAAGRPTVATPVAGFRELGPPVVTAERAGFVAAVEAALAPGRATGAAVTAEPTAVPTWHDRARAMTSLLSRARQLGDAP